MIDFPENPDTDDRYEDPNGVWWVYNGQSWNKLFTTVVGITETLNDIGDVDVGTPVGQENDLLTFIHTDYDEGYWATGTWNLELPKEHEFCYSFSSNVRGSGTYIVPYDTPILEHDNFDVNTYQFTVPRSGYWEFGMSSYVDNIYYSSWVTFYIYKDNAELVKLCKAGDVYNDRAWVMSGTYVDYFSYNDVVDIRMYTNDTNGIYYGGASNMFRGKFIEW